MGGSYNPNMPDVVIVIIALMMVLIACMVVVAVMREQKRQAALRVVATELGMTFDPKPPSVPNDTFELMQRGHGRRVRNLLRGPIEDITFEVFDYTFRTGHGNNRRTHRQSVVLFHMPTARLPKFLLGPERILHRLGASIFNLTDIDFRDDPVFSNRFVLRSDDQAAIRGVFTTDVREQMRALPDGIVVEADGNDVIVYRRRRRISPDELMPRITEAFEVASTIWRAAASSAGTGAR